MDHYFVSPYIPFKMDTIRMLTFVVLLINIVNNANEEIIISHINLSVAFWQFQVMSHLFAIAPVDRQSAAICKQIGSSVTSYLREVTPDTHNLGISASDFTKQLRLITFFTKDPNIYNDLSDATIELFLFDESFNFCVRGFREGVQTIYVCNLWGGGCGFNTCSNLIKSLCVTQM